MQLSELYELGRACKWSVLKFKLSLVKRKCITSVRVKVVIANKKSRCRKYYQKKMRIYDISYACLMIHIPIAFFHLIPVFCKISNIKMILCC